MYSATFCRPALALAVGLCLCVGVAAQQDTEPSRSPEASPHPDRGGEAGHGEEHNQHDEHRGRAVHLSPAERETLQVKLKEAGPGVIRRQVRLPAQVHLNPRAQTHITPRFPATLTEVKAKIGDRVEPGQVLARAENSNTLAPFELTTALGGRVIERHAVLGEHLRPSDTAFVVADLSRLWVDIALYPQQLGQVSAGQAVQLETGFGAESASARIDYVDPRVDEHLRTGLARVELDNDNGDWRPGMFARALITLEETAVEVRVPKTAVIDYEGRAVVFVREGEGFRPHPVTTGESDREHIAIRQGLTEGETYVARGGFILKADLQKHGFESGHSH